jgi:O-antigen/teichoic acid export membrane protein
MTAAVTNIAATPLEVTSATAQSGTRSLRSLAMRGSAWTIIGFGAAQGLRFAGNIVLTRLLFKEAFGLMALVSIFMQGLAMFSEVGIGPAIIQNPRGDEKSFLNTAWTIQVGRGLLLWIASFAIAWPAAKFYAEPMLTLLIPAVGFSAFVAGLNSTSVFTYNRHLQIGKLTIVEIISSLLGLMLTVAFAWWYRSVWSLVWGGVLTAIVKVALSFFMMPSHRHRLAWDRTATKELFTFGRWIFISTVLTFFALQGDRLIFGKMIPIGLLGVYSIALNLAIVPTAAITRVSGTVVFPAYTRNSHNPAYLPTIFHRVRFPLLAVGGMTVAGLIASGPILVRLVYRPEYHEAGLFVAILAVGVWFQITESTNGSALLAIGKANWLAACNAVKIAAMLTIIPLGFHFGGFHGALWALVIADALRYVVAALGCSINGLSSWSSDALLTLLTAGSAALGMIASRPLMPHRATWIGFLVAGTVVVACWAPVVLWSLRRKQVKGLEVV